MADGEWNRRVVSEWSIATIKTRPRATTRGAQHVGRKLPENHLHRRFWLLVIRLGSGGCRGRSRSNDRSDWRLDPSVHRPRRRVGEAHHGYTQAKDGTELQDKSGRLRTGEQPS